MIVIWQDLATSKAALWLCGVDPAQHFESIVILEFGKAALKIRAFEMTQMSVSNPTIVNVGSVSFGVTRFVDSMQTFDLM